MDIKFIEKLSYLIVIFIGVVIMTAYSIGYYNNKKKDDKPKKPNTIILNNIRF